MSHPPSPNQNPFRIEGQEIFGQLYGEVQVLHERQKIKQGVTLIWQQIPLLCHLKVETVTRNKHLSRGANKLLPVYFLGLMFSDDREIGVTYGFHFLSKATPVGEPANRLNHRYDCVCIPARKTTIQSPYHTTSICRIDTSRTSRTTIRGVLVHSVRGFKSGVNSLAVVSPLPPP